MNLSLAKYIAAGAVIGAAAMSFLAAILQYC